MLQSTTTYSVLGGGKPIPISPEVAPAAKSKPKRSAKPKSEQSQNPEESAIQTHPAPEPAPAGAQPANGVPNKPVYDWDRTHAEEARRKMPFPTPKATTLAFEDFCEYYNALREMPVSTYARLYVQRWWPVLLPVEKQDEFGNIKDSFPSDVKITLDDGPLSQQLMLQLAGVGQYKFRLNDTRRPWSQQTVAFSEFEISDRSLWNLNRAVFDLDRLDYDANRNQAYIKFARSVGILPREDEAEKEQAEMANVTAIDTVLEDARKERERTDRLQREALERAERDLKEQKEATAKAQAIKPDPPRPTTDLEAMGGVIVSLVNAVKPNPDNSLSEYLKLEAKREETRRETEKLDREAARAAAAAERARADKLQDEMLADLKKKADIAPVAPPVPVTRRQMLEDAVAEQNLLKELAGGRRGGQVEEEKPTNIDKWLEAAPIVGPIVQSVIGGIFQTIHFGLQTLQQINYNNALAKHGGEPKPPTTMEKPPEPGKPIAPQGPQPTPEQIAQQTHWNTILRGVETLAPHLIRFLDKGKSGAELADFVIENSEEQRTTYERIKHVAESLTVIGVQVPGNDDLERFLNASRFVFERVPQLWAKVGTLPTMAQFLTEFYNYDEMLAKAQEENAK